MRRLWILLVGITFFGMGLPAPATPEESSQDRLARLMPGITLAEAERILESQTPQDVDGWRCYDSPHPAFRSVALYALHFDDPDGMEAVHYEVKPGVLAGPDVVRIYRLRGEPERTVENLRMREVYPLSGGLFLCIVYDGITPQAPVHSLTFSRERDPFLTLPGSAQDLTGEWRVEGDGAYVVTLHQEGESVRGICGLDREVLYGEFKGGRLTIRHKHRKSPSEETVMLSLSRDGRTLTGTLQEKAALLGQASTKEVPWTWKRRKDENPARDDDKPGTSEVARGDLKARSQLGDFPDVDLREVRVAHNQSLRLGEGRFLGARFLLTFRIRNHKGEKCFAEIYFLNPKSRKRIKSDWKEYQSSAGNLIADTSFTPGSGDAVVEGLEILVPVRAFPAGTGEYGVELYIVNEKEDHQYYHNPTIYTIRVTR